MFDAAKAAKRRSWKRSEHLRLLPVAMCSSWKRSENLRVLEVALYSACELAMAMYSMI